MFLPEPKKQDVPNASIKDVLFKAPKTVYGFTIGQIIFSAFVFGYVTNISIIVQTEGLGNATEAGLAISLFTTGTLITGFMFGKLRSMLPNLIVPIGVLFTATGILWCSTVDSLTMIFVASVLGGMGLGIVIPGVLARVSELSNLAKGISYVGIAAAGQGLGGIVSPYMFATVLGIFGLEGGRSTLLVASIGLFVLAVVWAIITVRKSPVTVNDTDGQTEIA